MTTYEKLKGAVSVWSNSYGMPTGYGVQVTHLVDRLLRAGVKTAVLSNYGIEGAKSEIKTPYGIAPHYPRGIDTYSNDVAPVDHQLFTGQYPDLPKLLITLYDVWVLKSKLYDQIPKIASWVPLDHVTLPPKVEEWLVKPNVTPIAMAPNGVRMLEAKGIECEYVPHSIDTKALKPTYHVPGGTHIEDYFKSKDKFVVGMVAANKAAGLLHRKAFSENILAFSIFHKRHPDSLLYLHTEPSGLMSGWNLIELVKAAGIPEEAVIFPHPLEYRFGVSTPHLAALYTGMDVLLAPSYGEGFGVPQMEAQACGTRVIGSDWAAAEDLISEDGWKVDGQPQWDPGQSAWWRIPNVPSIVAALDEAYNLGKGRSEKAIEFAKEFDVENVWKKYWVPTLKKLLV
jgi:glycosyltransferase involved in cell wall biosynthesis